MHSTDLFILPCVVCVLPFSLDLALSHSPVKGVVACPTWLSLSVAPCRLLSGHSLSLRCPAYWRRSFATSPYLKGSEAFQG